MPPPNVPALSVKSQFVMVALDRELLLIAPPLVPDVFSRKSQSETVRVTSTPDEKLAIAPPWPVAWFDVKTELLMLA